MRFFHTDSKANIKILYFRILDLSKSTKVPFSFIIKKPLN